MKRHSAGNIGWLVLSLIVVAGTLSLYGATQVSQATSTVTGQCPLTATLQDGSPSGLTTTTTNTCTDTFTYPSTTTLSSSSSSSSSSAQNEMIQYTYGNGCQTIPGSAVQIGIIRWDTTPILPGGSDQWQLVFVLADHTDGITAVGYITTNNGVHTFYDQEYQGSTLIYQSETVQIPNEAAIHNGTDGLPSMVNTASAFPNDFGNQEFVDFYSDGDGVQMFWYGPHAAFQSFSYNLNLGVSLNVSSVSEFFAPLTTGQALTFQPNFALGYFILGQDNSNGAIPLTAATTNPCSTPFADSLEAVSGTNMCEVFNSYSTNSFSANIGVKIG